MVNSVKNSPCLKAKCLGLIIDHELNFQLHILSLKLSRTVGIISKLKHFLPQETLRQLYFALIQFQLLYGIIIWGSTFPSYLKRLTIL